MPSKKEPANEFEQLFTEVKEYMKLQAEMLQIQAIEKITKLLGMLFIIGIAFISISGLLFYLLMAVAYALAPLVGLVGSFAIVSGIFLLILLIFVIFRKRLIINPILRMMVKVFESTNKGEKEATNE